ncbi:MAG: M3 family oligoendopeptidase [Candidatus Shapirobacteria bacterium]|jgi:oligoendopeptidase F
MAKNEAENWNLSELGKVEDYDKLLAEIDSNIEVVEKWWKKLDPKMSKEEFAEFMEYDETLDEKFSRLGYLPELMESTNQKDSMARLMKSKASDLALKFNKTSRKIGHWLKGLEVEGKEKLDDTNAKRLFGAIPDLEYGLNYGRLAAKYTLPQREEEIIDNKDVNGIGAVSDLRGLIEADLVYDMEGKKIKNQADLLKYVHDTNPKKRESAYRALFKEHYKNIDKFFVIYQSVVKDWGYEAKLRGYKSAIEVRNFGNHVPNDAIETLLRVCREERKVFWRYFETKANLLKKKKLSRFDIYAPINLKSGKKIKYPEAKELVLKSFATFTKKFADMAEKVMVEGHIDSHPKTNKRSGAFCATVNPKVTPYVLLNYTDSQRDVSTLAHELGHAVHSLYANHHYSSAQHANLPLSETASTFGELVLFEYMLAKENDNAIKKQMLSEKIGDSYATILRQNYFVMFELKAHEMITKGTTAEELCNEYWNNLKEQFGNSVKLDKVFRYEWLYISHIFESPFYCYAYNFGELLSLSLYAKYKREGEKFASKIETVLADGGSRAPEAVLADVGVNMNDEKFWRGGFELIRGWQNQLEAL